MISSAVAWFIREHWFCTLFIIYIVFATTRDIIVTLLEAGRDILVEFNRGDK